MRILLYTGKGGVGKTTVAAATGLGKRMLLDREGFESHTLTVPLRFLGRRETAAKAGDFGL